MKKKKENLNFNFKVPKIDPNSDDVFKIDPKLEKQYTIREIHLFPLW